MISNGRQSDKKSKMAGIVLTFTVNAFILFVCGFSGLKYIYPPPEENSILMELLPSPDPKPIEVAAGIEPKAEIPHPDKPIKLVQKSKAPNTGTKNNKATESTVGKDGDIEVPEPKREKPIDKRALFSAADNNKKDTLAPQVANRVSDALKAGHPMGNTRLGDTDGEPSAKLAGRSLMGSLPIPPYNVQKAGKVVVRITVNRNGEVTTAIPGYTGTTVTDKTLWEAAKKAALQAKFNISSSAPESQQGTITYIFKLH